MKWLGRFFRRLADLARAFGRMSLVLAARVYALLLAGLTIWLTWIVMSYLVKGFFVSVPSPAAVSDLPRRIDSEMLQRGPAGFAALAATDHPRMPPAHYHRFDNWFQPDRFNDCTRSGCHGPLPHHRSKESRAFLNLHATSMHCGVCHFESDEYPLPMTWYDLTDGTATEPPAILRAFRLLHDAPATDGDTLRENLIHFLREAAIQAGDNEELRLLADHLFATETDDPGFARLIATIREIVPDHMRGEYGARLAVADSTGKPLLGHPGGAAATREFLANPQVEGAPRDALLERVHTRRARETRSCTDCHVAEDGVVRFADLGYSPTRVEQLLRPLVIQAIEHSMEGRPFHLPGFLEPSDSAPASGDDASSD